jgi:hydrogenase maturation factor HypF (carbamoyltransferase family)
LAKFLTPLRLEDIDGEVAMLFEALVYESDVLGRTIEAPAMMVTDFASIPRGLWNILPKRGKHDRAAVLHDACYRGFIQTTRKEADNVFLEAMEASGVGWLSRQLMYRAVRMFGRKAYREKVF